MVKKVILASVVVVVLAGLGWWALSGQPNATLNSFEDCVQAGYSIQESYPEVCVTPDGQRFPNPDQSIPTNP